jgi:hypothetical protein
MDLDGNWTTPIDIDDEYSHSETRVMTHDSSRRESISQHFVNLFPGSTDVSSRNRYVNDKREMNLYDLL